MQLTLWFLCNLIQVAVKDSGFIQIIFSFCSHYSVITGFVSNWNRFQVLVVIIIPHCLLWYINMVIALYEIIWFNITTIVNINVIILGVAEVFFKLNSIMKSFCYASDNYAKVSVFHVTFSMTYNWVPYFY